jgi:hypothetical protein
VKSGWVLYSPTAPFSERLRSHGHSPNSELLGILSGSQDVREDLTFSSLVTRDFLVLEFPQSYNTPASMGLFMTAHWSGVFRKAWGDDSRCALVARPSVKALIAGSANADDTIIKRAVEGRFGGREMAIGDQRCPGCDGKGGMGRGCLRMVCPECNGLKRTPAGPLHGVVRDVWQALALALAYSEGVKCIDREIWSGNA